MHETAAELEQLQGLLDRSYEHAGAHLRGIWGEDSRLDAKSLTVNPRSEPRVAPVDGFFFRGRIEAKTLLAFKRR